MYTKWKSKIEIVDIESGEILTRKHVDQGLYVVIKKTKQKTTESYEKNLKILERTIRWECIRNPQQKLGI